MKALFFRSDGTVTIFCALVMMVLVLFFMVLIDMSRIFLFHRTTESALKLSAQSVISAYDRQLYMKYGLFGRGGTDAQQLFGQTLELNLMNSLSVFSFEQGSDFAEPNIEGLEVYETEYLGQHHVFERQVLEEMKYKGPIDFTIELLEQWLPLQNAVVMADEMISSITKLQKLYEEREAHLEQALLLQKQLGKLLSTSFRNAIYNGASSTLNRYSSYISWLKHGEKVLDDINKRIDSLSDIELEILLEHASKYDSQINSFEQTASKAVSTISEEGERALERLISLAKSIDSHIQTARAIDQTMTIQYELYLSEASKRKTDGSSALGDELDQVEFDETMIRGEQYFIQYRTAVQMQQSELQDIVVEGIHFASRIRELVDHPNVNDGRNEDVQLVKELRDQIRQSIDDYISSYSSPATKLTPWQESVSDQHQIRSQIKAYEQQFEEEMATLGMITALLDSGDQLQKVSATYDELNERYESNKSRNMLADDKSLELLSLDHSANEQAKLSTSQLANVLKRLSSVAAEFRDEVYINEYMMSKFSAFPVGELNINDGKLSDELLYPSQQEIEYVLYGIHEPLANVMLAFGEVFVFRLAIRTIEGFIANRTLTHPLLILSAAVAHGARLAVSDMKQLMEDGTTVLSKYAPIDVTYEQYLRLFLLLHAGGKTSKLSRMIALIEQNTDLSLLQVPTSITASAEFSLNLWSFPILAQLTNIVSNSGSEVKGNVYKKYELATASY